MRWAIGGTVLLAGLAAVAFVARSRSGPEIVVNAPVTPEPAPPAPPRPAELPPVVDVTDIDPLLDPPPIPAAVGVAPVLTAVGYEEPAAPAPPTGDVPPIPPAAEDEPAAVTLGELPVVAVRVGWYGGEWGRIEGKVADFWAEWVPFPPGFVSSPYYTVPAPGRGGINVGIGLYF